MSQLIAKKKRGGNNAKPPQTRKLFMLAYEESCGNVSASCTVAGISRRTYYRWLESPSRVNQKFREALSRIRPTERLLDIAEAVMLRGVQEGDRSSARYILDKRGRSRGYGNNPETVEPDPVRVTLPAPEIPLIEKVAAACLHCMEDHKIEGEAEKWALVKRFAKARNVDQNELGERCGLVIEAEVQR